VWRTPQRGKHIPEPQWENLIILWAPMQLRSQDPASVSCHVQVMLVALINSDLAYCGTSAVFQPRIGSKVPQVSLLSR
jgi:hypothetical protein